MDVHLDAQAIAWRLHRPWPTIRWWAHKGWLTPVGTDPEGRKLYSYQQAREVAAVHLHEYDPCERGLLPGVSVTACALCGKWQLHHIHTGDPAACTCDTCNTPELDNHP